MKKPSVVPQSNNPQQAKPSGGLLDEHQTAVELDVEVRTLQAWRQRGGGPPFVKLGRLVRYRPCDLDAFVRSRLRATTRRAAEVA